MYIDSIVCDKQTLSLFLKTVLSDIQQKDLSSRLGIDPSRMSRMLNGSNFTIDSFFALLHELDIQCILVYDREFIPCNESVSSEPYVGYFDTLLRAEGVILEFSED